MWSGGFYDVTTLPNFAHCARAAHFAAGPIPIQAVHDVQAAADILDASEMLRLARVDKVPQTRFLGASFDIEALRRAACYADFDPPVPQQRTGWKGSAKRTPCPAQLLL